MYAIRCKKSHRYYYGEEFLRLYDDFVPVWGLAADDYSNAVIYESKEKAEGALRCIDNCAQYDCEVVEIPD